MPEPTQLDRLRTLCEWCEAQSPFYRERWRAAGFTADKLRTLDDIRRIPFVTKADLLEDQKEEPPFGRRLTVEPASLARVFLTSGTSGIGQEIHCLTSTEWKETSAPVAWQAARVGLQAGDGFAMTLPMGMQMGGPYLAKAAEEIGFLLYVLAAHSTEERAEHLRRFRPAALQFTPAYGARLQASEQNAGVERWPPGMKALFVSAESYTPRWAEAVMDYWGAPLLEYYGTTQAGMGHAVSCERGVLWDDGSPGILHNADPWVVCEVLDRESGLPVDEGDPGEIIVTSLFKRASPVVRFRSDDRGVRRVGASCPCGTQWDGLSAGEIGRFDDMMKIKGQNVWPSTFHAVIDGVLPGAEYRGRVFIDEEGRERVSVLVEAQPETSLEQLAAAIRARTNVTVELEAVRPDTFERFEFKSRRWEDTRRTDREVIAYRAR